MISWNVKTRDLGPIGLDIGHSSIKMIQFGINGGRARVHAANKIRIDAGVNGDETKRRELVVLAVKAMMAGGDFQGKGVVSCLPSEGLRITSLRLSRADEVEQALVEEVSRRFGFDAEKDTINYLPAGEVRQDDDVKNEYIVFATDDETIRSHISMLEEAGLRPAAIDVAACALFRSFERSLRRQEDREQTYIFADIGSRFTTMVFSRSGEISLVKQMAIGVENFDRQIAAKLDIDISEAGILRGMLGKAKRTDRSAGTNPDQMPAEQDAVPVKSGDGEQEPDATARQVIIDAVNTVAEELANEISLCIRYYTVTFRGKRVERAVFSGGGAYEDILLNVLRRKLAVDVELASPLRGLDMSSGGMQLDLNGDRRGLLCEWAVAVGLGLKGSKRTGNVGTR